jgi:uncharacterized cupredoxin-like copper-binding protein
MFKFISSFFFIFILAAGSFAGQKELMEKQAQELLDLNNIVLKNLEEVRKVKNGNVYIKAKVIDREKGKYILKVEKVVLDKKKLKKEMALPETGNKTIYLQGKTSTDKDHKFKLDLESVIPPGFEGTETKKESSEKADKAKVQTGKESSNREKTK